MAGSGLCSGLNDDKPYFLNPVEEPIWTFLSAFSLGLVLAVATSWLMLRQIRHRAEEEAETRKELVIREGEVEVRAMKAAAAEKLRESQARLTREREAFEQESRQWEVESSAREEQIDQREAEVRRKLEEVEQRLTRQKDLETTLAVEQVRLRKAMEGLAGLPAEEVLLQLRSEVAKQHAEELRLLRREMEQRSGAELQEQARRTLMTCMQRLSAQPQNDITATIVHLPNDDMKGRIIGREGRNIKCFETATGVTLLIDESPNMVLVSSFDPVRREVARLALERLIQDGRIHPASIEDFVEHARHEVDQLVVAAGERALDHLKIPLPDASVVEILGRLKFRSSLTQNVLDHSVEVAQLCSLLAAELGLDPMVAKRAGLYHDLGKGMDAEFGGSHARVGADFLRRHGESPVVVNAVAAHHEEVPPESLYAGLVILADRVSAIRPGARAESMAAYLERLGNLEKLVLEFPGIQSVCAIQAGREVRILVDPVAVEEADVPALARKIRLRIENELDYPSTIRITIIRERRFQELAH